MRSSNLTTKREGFVEQRTRVKARDYVRNVSSVACGASICFGANLSPCEIKKKGFAINNLPCTGGTSVSDRAGTLVCGSAPSSCGLMGQKYSVVWATLRQAATHALDLDDEPTIAQTLLEFPIIPGRPNGQHSAALESGTNGS